MELLRRPKDGDKSKKDEKKEQDKEKEKEQLQHGSSGVGTDTSAKKVQKDNSLAQLLNQQNLEWEKEKIDAEKESKKERPTLHSIELPSLKPAAFGVWRAFHELSYPPPKDIIEDLEASGIPPSIQEHFKVGFIENIMDVAQALAKRFSKDELNAAGLHFMKDWAQKKVPALVFPYLRDEEICFIACRALLSQEERHELDIRRYERMGEKIPFPFNSNTFSDMLDRERKKVFFLYPSRYRLNILSKEEDVLIVEEKGFPAIAIRDFHIEEEWYKLFVNVEPVIIIDQTDRKFPDYQQRIDQLSRDFARHDMNMRIEVLPDGIFVPDWFVKSNLGERKVKAEHAPPARKPESE